MKIGQILTDHDSQPCQNQYSSNDIATRQTFPAEQRFHQDSQDGEAEQGQHTDCHRRYLHGMKERHPMNTEQNPQAIDTHQVSH